jgi:hypothetical protein
MDAPQAKMGRMVYRQRTRTQTPFGEYLDEVLQERDQSVRSFARLVGVTSASITTFKRTKPPKERIIPWADALRLTGEVRYRFIELAWLTHTPPLIQERYADMVDELARMRAKAARAKGRLSRS